MTIHKLKSIKILGISTDEYVGTAGTIFYDDEAGVLKLSDGQTYGGTNITAGSSEAPVVIDGGNASTTF